MWVSLALTISQAVSSSALQSEHNFDEPQDPWQSPPGLQHGPEYNRDCNTVLSQLSDEATITVDSHSQTATVDSQESLPLSKTAKVYVDAVCQTAHVVFLSREEYENLLKCV